MPSGGSFIRMGSGPSSYRGDVLRDPEPLTIALSTGSWGRSGDPDGEVAHRALFVAELLESLGHRVESVEDKLVCDWPSLWRAFAIQWIGSRSQLEVLAAERGLAPAELRDLLTPMASRHLAGASAYGTYDLWERMACNERVTRQAGSLMDNYDLLLTPTFTSRIPVADGPFSTLRDEDLETWFDRFCDGCRYTILGNETGFPAVALPAGLDAEGMPLGVQFYGGAGSESLLLKIGAQLERARPDWFSAVPRVHVTRPGGEADREADGAPGGPARLAPLASPG
jgi:amidase